jgi:hypothetical protein
MRPIVIGPVFGLRTTLMPLFWLSYLVLAALAACLALVLVHLTLGMAILAGVLSALLFLVCEWLHQFGHSLAARQVGHPMIGIHFFNLFSAGEYPSDERPLPPRVHIRRALGGFWVNIVIGLLLLPIAVTLWPRGGEILPPAVNIIVLGLGALLPLKIPGGGLNDGGTLLHYWREAQRKPEQT